MEKVEQLAELLLNSSWESDELIPIVGAVANFARQSKEDLVERITARFPSPPSRAALVDYLRRIKNLNRALRKKLLRQHQKAIRFKVTTMRASLPVAKDWELPTIAHVGELGEFLNLPIQFIEWLATHRHSHYQLNLVPKRSVGVRLLEAPKARLKHVQRRIAADILSSIPAHSASHAFARKRSALSYVQPHIGQAVVLRLDLVDFFPSMTASRVFGLFRSLGYPYAVTHLLTNLCTSVVPSGVFENAIEKLDRLTSSFNQAHAIRHQLRSRYCRLHLPQGAPTSPKLANLIAYRLDCRLSGLATSANATYTRYADDLLFSGDKEFGRCVSSFSTQVAAIAVEEGFEVNYRKTRIMRSSTRQLAAGIIINQQTNVRREEYDQLKAIIHNCIRTGPANQNRDSLPHFRMHLLGRINWVNQLNPARGKKLMAIFEKIDWTTTDASRPA